MASAPIAKSIRLVIARVTSTAMVMPMMPKRLARRAVSGWDSPFRARMKRTLARRYQSAMAFADIATLLLHPGVFSRGFLLLEHFEHSLGHQEAAEGIDGHERHGNRAEHRPAIEGT